MSDRDITKTTHIVYDIRWDDRPPAFPGSSVWIAYAHESYISPPTCLGVFTSRDKAAAALLERYHAAPYYDPKATVSADGEIDEWLWLEGHEVQ